jgi:thioesterase domain-containing protein
LPNTTLLHSRIYGLARRIEHHWDDLRMLKPGTRWNYVAEKVEKGKRKLWRAKRKYRDLTRTHGPVMVIRTWLDLILGRKRLTPYAAPGILPNDYRKTEGNIRTAWENFVPHSYAGRVTLFRASKQALGIYPDPSLGWNGLVAELEIHEVQGHHGSMIAEPYVQFLAEELGRCIEKAELEASQTVEAPQLIESSPREFAYAAV